MIVNDLFYTILIIIFCTDRFWGVSIPWYIKCSSKNIGNFTVFMFAKI